MQTLEGFHKVTIGPTNDTQFSQSNLGLEYDFGSSEVLISVSPYTEDFEEKVKIKAM